MSRKLSLAATLISCMQALTHPNQRFIDGEIMQSLSGTSIIGFARQSSKDGFRAINPSTGEPLEPPYSNATTAEVYEAADLAYRAFAQYRNASGKVKGTFLRRIAANLEQLDDVLIARAVAETALPQARI